jgi:hypothetical protein
MGFFLMTRGAISDKFFLNISLHSNFSQLTYVFLNTWIILNSFPKSPCKFYELGKAQVSLLCFQGDLAWIIRVTGANCYQMHSHKRWSTVESESQSVNKKMILHLFSKNKPNLHAWRACNWRAWIRKKVRIVFIPSNSNKEERTGTKL